MNTNNVTLEQTVTMMNSKNYKVRFVGEYLQTKIRYDKLHNMIVRYEAGTLAFEPTCSLDVLKEQAKAMNEYLHVLEVRAEIEKINLNYTPDVEPTTSTAVVAYGKVIHGVITPTSTDSTTISSHENQKVMLNNGSNTR